MEVKGLDKLMRRMEGLPAGIDAAVKHTVQEWGEYYYQATQHACPVDKGTLAASGINETDVENKTVRIVYQAKHAKPVEYGWQRTQPIFPVRKRALAWEADRVGRLSVGGRAPGNRVVVKYVLTPARHQGTSYIRVPLQRAKPLIHDFFRQGMQLHGGAT